MQKRMVGKFYPTPDDIVDDLFSLSTSAIVLYFSLTMRHYIEENSTFDDGWVTGKVKAKQKVIIEKSTLARATYYKALYELIENDFVKIEDGEFVILRLKKVESKAEVEREVEVIEHRITRNVLKVIMKDIRSLYGLHEEEAEEENQLLLSLEEKVFKNYTKDNQKDEEVFKIHTDEQEDEQTNSGVGVQNLNKSVQNLNKIVLNFEHPIYRSLEREDHAHTHADPGTLVQIFYGEKKISEKKRVRAFENISELEKEGFTLDDIEFAVKWTKENVKKEIYDFVFIKETIGQAMTAKKEYEEKERRKAENEAKKVVQEEDNQKSIEQADCFRSVKEKMTPEEREVLRQKAFALAEKRNMMREFLTENTIEALENEILENQK